MGLDDRRDDREAEPGPGVAGRLTAFAGSTGTFMADCKLLPAAGVGFVAMANGGWTEVGAALQEVFGQVTS